MPHRQGVTGRILMYLATVVVLAACTMGEIFNAPYAIDVGSSPDAKRFRSLVAISRGPRKILAS